jgi:tetratricopeptide (TPR) repeat protein
MKLQGEAYFSMEKYADSETCFKKVKGKLGDDSDVIFKLGISLYQQKKFDEGVEKLHEALNLSKDVDEGRVAYWLGKSYLGKNQIGQAMYYLSRAFGTINNFFFEDEYSKIME